MGTQPDRRNVRYRARLVQQAIADIVLRPATTITLASVETQLGIGGDAAERIMRRLVKAGIAEEVRQGHWIRRGANSEP